MILKDVEFERTNLIASQLCRTNLNGIDLSSSDITGVAISQEYIKGLIVNEMQAVELSKLLGVVIK